MRRDEVLAILAEHQEEIRALGTTALSVFGPIIYDQDDPEDEIDILVELQPDSGMFTFVGVKVYLEELLGRSVHLVTPGGIHERERRDQILKEAVRAA